MVMFDIPAHSHSSFPSRSYERILFVPAVINSVRLSFSHTNGVDQLVFSSRFTRQIWSPVSALRQRRYEPFSLSLTINKRSLWRAGDDAVPQLNLVGTESNFFDQTGLPSRS